MVDRRWELVDGKWEVLMTVLGGLHYHVMKHPIGIALIWSNLTFEI